MSAMHRGLFRTIRGATHFDIEYDLGFDIKVTYPSRLVYPNSDEPLFTRDKGFGKTAKQWVSDWVISHPSVDVELVKRENGVAYVRIIDGDTTLNQHIIDQGYELIPSEKRDTRMPLYEPEGIVIPQLILNENEYDEDAIVRTTNKKSWVF